MKTFLIHLDSATERKRHVEEIVKLTGAEIVPAVSGYLPENWKINAPGHYGCRDSHIKCMNLSEEDCLIFEDDCEILDSNILKMLPQIKGLYDFIYLGALPHSEIRTSLMYGTHSIWVSKKAKECFFKHLEETDTVYIDGIWNEVRRKYNLKTWLPLPLDKYTRQSQGLISYINGGFRDENGRRVEVPISIQV